MQLKIVCAVATFLLCFASVAISQPSREELLEMRVRGVVIDDESLHLALSEIASKYRIPIGLESAAAPDELLQNERIVVNIPEGTVRDVLDSVVQCAPDYQWSVVDGVINVTPKQRRDKLLMNILDTSISTFAVETGTSRLSIRTALTAIPEIRTKLEATKLKPLVLATNSIDYREAAPGFSLRTTNTTMRAILNKIIEKSEAKYWLVSRYGEKREFLIVNF